eukprot:4915524-Prymnesium_polylepis.1
MASFSRANETLCPRRGGLLVERAAACHVQCHPPSPRPLASNGSLWAAGIPSRRIPSLPGRGEIRLDPGRRDSHHVPPPVVRSHHTPAYQLSSFSCRISVVAFQLSPLSA